MKFRSPAVSLLSIGCLLLLGGCLSQSESDHEFAADITRTQFGIPHVTAPDYKGLGYGLGYAFAQDNLCSLSREIVIANGQSALYLEETRANIERDIFYTWYNAEARRRALLQEQPAEVQDAIAGYAAGYNRYLRETGVDNLHRACAGEPWVREIDVLDLSAVYNKGNLRGGLANFVHQIVAATPFPPATADAPP
ncbi:MAG: penicillin acylase family protein [Pseudomonadales bacterium]|nr:penicillin acylase family protein [Pseudomonadales bacterium]